ncbi:unnamed protein product [Orchesella dallaii]|uniref:FAD-binding PCMH-type domain-containing protein n=1 Tax=Orchesella dallaii TaxID=48710 RepID=A0ABP1QI06_9HEXA
MERLPVIRKLTLFHNPKITVTENFKAREKMNIPQFKTVTVLFFSLVLGSFINSQTVEELEEWNDILNGEAVEILPYQDSDFEEPQIDPLHLDKDNRLALPFNLNFLTGTPDCPTPPNFPFGIYAQLSDFSNWAESLRVQNLWTVQPRTPKDVVALANWAYVYGYQLRAKGFSNSWAPLTVTQNTKCSSTIMVDTTKYLTQMKMISSKTNDHLRAVHVQTGASMENLMVFLEHHNAGLYAAPMMGHSTVGGVLAVGGHGIGAPRRGTRAPTGYSAGSLSNLILSFKAIVWDHDAQSYTLKKFTRTDEDSKAFLTHIGRAFLTDVRLMVGPAYNMHCESHFDYTPETLLAKPTHINSHQESLAGLLEKFNSVDLSIYPYSDSMWTMICSNSTRLGDGSRYIAKPYPFADRATDEGVSRSVSALVSQFLAGFHYLSPLISKVSYNFDMLNIKMSRNDNIWGTSNNILLRYRDLYVKSTSSGYAILINRDRVQKVASEIYSFYSGLVGKYSAAWKFPQNEPFQITVTGLDDPAEIPGLGEFDPPALSFLSPMRGKNFDTAVFIQVSAIVGTRHYESFMRELESFLFLKYDGNDAVVRPEWSKSWAYTDFAAWDNQILLKKVIPTSFGENWSWALQRFDHYDPYNIFSNDFLDTFLKANNTLKLKIN